MATRKTLYPCLHVVVSLHLERLLLASVDHPPFVDSLILPPFVFVDPHCTVVFLNNALHLTNSSSSPSDWGALSWGPGLGALLYSGFTVRDFVLVAFNFPSSVLMAFSQWDQIQYTEKLTHSEISAISSSPSFLISSKASLFLFILTGSKPLWQSCLFYSAFSIPCIINHHVHFIFPSTSFISTHFSCYHSDLGVY